MKRINKQRGLLIGVATLVCTLSCGTLLACNSEEGYKTETADAVAQHVVYNVGTSIDLFDLFETGEGYSYTFKVGKAGGSTKEDVLGRSYYAKESGEYVVECVGYKDNVKRTGSATFTISDTLPYMVINGKAIEMNYNSTITVERLISSVSIFCDSDTSVEYTVDTVDYYKNPWVTEPISYDLTEGAVGEGFYDGEGKLKFNGEGTYDFHLIATNAGGSADGNFEVKIKENLENYKELGGVEYDFDTKIASWDAIENAAFYRVKIDYENVITDETSLKVDDYFAEGSGAIRCFDLAVIPLDENKNEIKYEDAEGYTSNGMLIERELIIAPEEYGQIILGSTTTVDAETGIATVEGAKATTGLGRAGIGLMDNGYLAWRGDYGLNTYVDFEFKGNNIPNICFFADEINNSLTYGGKSDPKDKNKGLVIISGIYGAYSGSTYYLAGGDTIAAFGPYRLECGWSAPNYRWCTMDGTPATTPIYMSTGKNGWDPSPYTLLTQNGLKNDTSDRTYRYVVGTYGRPKEGSDATEIVISMKLYDVATGELIYDVAQPTGLTTADFAIDGEFKGGNIIVYAPSKEESSTSQFKVSKPYYVPQNVSSYSGATFNADGSVTLKGSAVASGNNGHVRLVEQSYVAWQGDYGVGTYVEFEFKGNNMPQLCFFADEINPFISKGDKDNGTVVNDGFMILNGIKTDGVNGFTNGLRAYGMHRYDQGEKDSPLANWLRYDDPNSDNDYPLLTMQGLEEDTSGRTYRMVIGTSLNEEQVLCLDIYLFDKATGESIYRISNPVSTEFKAANPDMSALKGHIIAFAGIKGADVDTTFTVTKAPGTIDKFDVKEKQLNLGATFNDDGSVTLKGNSTISANNGHVRLVEQSYIAWKGDYGVDTYIEFEFKGNNMPQLCFFANNINGQMCYSTPTSTDVINDGFIVLNGIKSDNGTNDFNDKLKAWGNHRYDVGSSKSEIIIQKGGADDGGLSQADLAANPDKTYRMVIGTTLNAEKTRLFLVIRLFDKETNEKIASLDISTGKAPSHFVTGENTEPTGHIIAFAGLKGGEDTTFTVTKGPAARSEFDMTGATA